MEVSIKFWEKFIWVNPTGMVIFFDVGRLGWVVDDGCVEGTDLIYVFGVFAIYPLIGMPQEF